MTVDPGLIRAEAYPEVGSLIQRDASILIERWTRRALQEQPHAQRVHHQALVDHFHELLAALGRSLTESDDAATGQHCLPATIHGEERWETGWSLPELVRDYQILRLVILDYLEEVHEQPPSHRVVMAIGLALDEAIAASATRYVTSRDRHLRLLEEERAERDKQIQEHLRQRADTLREVDRRKNEFMATLGHEMRNPLAPLWHAARLLELHATMEPVSLEQVRDIIKRQVEQLGRLADDLLDISRIAQAKVELRKEPVNLVDVITQAVQTSAPHIKARHHQFDVVAPSEPIWLEADPARLVQIIVNLLNNAAKYTEPGGHIRLTAGKEADGTTAIRVRDNGMGIPAEMLPHVFELFTQGEWSADHAQGGMGIGLALVRRLVELHGGTITASSPGLGQGSEFVVCLPIHPHGPGCLNGQSRHAEEESAAPSAASPRRILVVDDNVDAAESLRMLLSLEGHEVRLAHDGVAALRIAQEMQPNVVLLDIGLPRMDGYEVARRLRQQPEMERLLLVALTGYGQDDDRRRSHEAGFNAHLVKPVDLDGLRMALAHFGSLVPSRATT
jgi:signal transduction histidine kinase/ActR/RegA family two-component response regulator